MLKHVGIVVCAAVVATLVLAAIAQASNPGLGWQVHARNYSNQAAAQRAADTRDPDGDGIYCESLPCPCLKPGGGQQPTSPLVERHGKTRYPNIRRHYLRALRKGWTAVLVLNRSGASARRKRLLEGVSTRSGYDRDEYPPAAGRGRGRGLTRGAHPTGWKADVAYVPSHENRSHGSTLGTKLRRYYNGTRFRYVFY